MNRAQTTHLLPAIFGALMLTACAPVVPAANGEMLATADLRDASGKTVGSANVRSIGSGIAVTVEARGMAPGAHGVHIHSAGTCTAPDFASAGPHLNLTGKAHGFHNPAGYHEGDLPNMIVGPDGRGVLSAQLGGDVAAIGRALHDDDGSAIVIHATADDMKSDPAGNSGGRIACGRLEAPIR